MCSCARERLRLGRHALQRCPAADSPCPPAPTALLPPLLPAVDADPGAAPRGAQAGDVISKLVGIYGGKEQLIGEYR